MRIDMLKPRYETTEVVQSENLLEGIHTAEVPHDSTAILDHKALADNINRDPNHLGGHR